MEIKELLLKNFGKFADRRISLTEGINILYGENESGKSTVHTFIRGMLFGIKRGRGRAAAGDTFSLYEPWENPNYYSGRLRFTTGGKDFSIERNFDRYAKKTAVFCENDGEELSAEDGDLKMLLDGLTASGYDNTVSVAQMKVQPGSSLAAELKNYATNYYVTGDSDLDLEKALAHLKERGKEADRGLRLAEERKREERERLELESSYVWRDIHRLTEERDSLEEEIAYRRGLEEAAADKEPEVKRVIDELRPPKWRIHPLEILVIASVLVLLFILIPRPLNYFVTVVVFLCGLIYIWNRLKVGKKKPPEETEEEPEEPLKHLQWEAARCEEELKDRQIRYENLRERLAELDEISREHAEYDRRKEAAALAARRIEELAAGLQAKLREDLNAAASRIIAEITGGKYTRLIVGQGLSMSLLSDGRRIPVEQLSRGTIEQIYFAFRMASGEILYREDYPVILDDTFVCYDDVRLGQTLAWLGEKKRQVLVFTCQNREEEALRRLGIPYTKVCL